MPAVLPEDIPEISEEDLYPASDISESMQPYMEDSDDMEEDDKETEYTTDEMVQEIMEVTEDTDSERINLYRALTFMSAKLSTTGEIRNSDFPFISERTFRGELVNMYGVYIGSH